MNKRAQFHPLWMYKYIFPYIFFSGWYFVVAVQHKFTLTVFDQFIQYCSFFLSCSYCYKNFVLWMRWYYLLFSRVTYTWQIILKYKCAIYICYVLNHIDRPGAHIVRLYSEKKIDHMVWCTRHSYSRMKKKTQINFQL